MVRREINTGRGTELTNLTPFQIALIRSRQIDGAAERILFQDTFSRVRHVAPGMSDREVLWTVMGGRHTDPVMEAAYIEALASLRADGMRL
jgi:hypothetical protein